MSEIIQQQSDVKEIGSDPVAEVAKRMPQNPEFETFRTADGPFGWFEHGVNGREMNRFVHTVQKHMIESNENDSDLYTKYSELLQIVNRFDENYLIMAENAVNSSVQAAEEAREARKELDGLKSRIDKLNKKCKMLSWILGCSVLIAVIAVILKFL